MTPEEFRCASRELHTLLNEPASIASASEFADELEQLPEYCDCRFSDAWRCAKDKNLIGQIACRCKCHRYLEV